MIKRLNFLGIRGIGLSRLLLLLALFATFTIIQSACGSKYFFEEKKDIPREGWAYVDTLDFSFTVTDTLETYNLYLDFEYTDTFATQNIYIKLHTLFPNGKRLSKQKSFDFFDVQGKPQGTCSGNTCKLHTVLQEKAYFNSPGEYKITLEQYTRQNPLPGIFSISLAVEPTGISRSSSNEGE